MKHAVSCTFILVPFIVVVDVGVVADAQVAAGYCNKMSTGAINCVSLGKFLAAHHVDNAASAQWGETFLNFYLNGVIKLK